MSAAIVETPMKTNNVFKIITASTNSPFTPRLGRVTIPRRISEDISIDTPGLITSSSRGIVPHLSRDHVAGSSAIKWVHVPFETFLERVPPLPSLQPGPHPLNTLLGLPREKTVLSLSLRDPCDTRELPPNGKDYVCAHTVRGVRKMAPSAWRGHTQTCAPDFVVALADTPYTPPPFSQKRLSKSLERSAEWLAALLQSQGADSDSVHEKPHVLVHMAGDVSAAARRAFAAGLVETLYGKEAQQIAPLRTLDDGVCGYTFDIHPLRLSLRTEATTKEIGPGGESAAIAALMRASLEVLQSPKMRIVYGAESPHEVLALIGGAGADIFDAHWAQKAADWGVALDFAFPVPLVQTGGPGVRGDGKRDIGHNLYAHAYAFDFSRFAACFLDALRAETMRPDSELDVICPCVACSPVPPRSCLVHSAVDAAPETTTPNFDPPFTRAYVHHLLHTHEMSAHALLAAHNLAVVDLFFAGIRRVVSADESGETFAREVARFGEVYDSPLRVFEEARRDWKQVDLARGKGRLAREKAKQAESGFGLQDVSGFKEYKESGKLAN